MGDKEDYIDNLILKGAIEVYGIDSETGEFLYSFTEKLKDVDPEAYRASLAYYDSMVTSLWVKGFIYINMEDESPLVRITEKSLQDEAWIELSREEATILKIMMQAMKNN